MKRRPLKRVLTCIAVIAGILVCIVIAALAVLQIRTNAVLDDYSAVYKNEKYQTPVMIEGNQKIQTGDCQIWAAV